MNIEILAKPLTDAIAFARKTIDVIPESAHPADECATIEAASASADALAGLALSLPGDDAVKALAAAWLDGTLPAA